jgi:2-haloacid dehalogenase
MPRPDDSSTPPRTAAPGVVVFDLGGVLLDWNPRHLYRKLFAGDEAAMERFLAEVCTGEWNARQDAGRPFDEAVAALMPRHADQRHLIEAWRDRFDEMIPGPLDDTLAVAEELRGGGVPLYALTNWSAETFAGQRRRFPFFAWFDGIVVSGAERVMKPDRRIYEILLARYAIEPGDAVFIDDNPANARAASELGMHGIHFRTADALRSELRALGLL